MMRGHSRSDSLELTAMIDDKFVNNSLAQRYIAGEQRRAEGATAD